MIAHAHYAYDGVAVLVTGGGTGIGRAITRAFLEQGAGVSLVGRSAEALAEAVSGFPPERVHIQAIDLAVPGAAATAVGAAVDRFGRLDVVVANAGTSEASDITSFNSEVWHRLRAINLDAVIELAGAAAPHLARTRGNFLAISSIAGMRGEWGMYAYAATKGAVNVLVQSLALDLGASGVRVNALAPGFTVSRLTSERLADPAFAARLRERIALGRVAEPDDIARAALFLCGPDAGYITGAVLPVDGGMSASNGTPAPV